jgi:hypothetical protein
MPIGLVYALMSDETHDWYIGSTTQRLKDRMKRHRYESKTEWRPKYHYPLYECIRAHGGMDCWRLVEIERVEYSTISELRLREEELRCELGPTLNVLRASRAVPDIA